MKGHSLKKVNGLLVLSAFSSVLVFCSCAFPNYMSDKNTEASPYITSHYEIYQNSNSQVADTSDNDASTAKNLASEEDIICFAVTTPKPSAVFHADDEISIALIEASAEPSLQIQTATPNTSSSVTALLPTSTFSAIPECTPQGMISPSCTPTLIIPTVSLTPTPGVVPTGIDNNTFLVSFFDDKDTLLKQEYVKNGNDALAPDIPEKDGYLFAGWIGDTKCITSDRSIRSSFLSIEEKNIFYIEPATVTQGETFEITFRLLGEVCLCDFDIVMSYDNKSIVIIDLDYEDGIADIVNINHGKGEIYLNFSRAMNYQKQKEIVKLYFSVKPDALPVDTQICIKQIRKAEFLEGDAIVTAEYNTIDGEVHIR